MTQILRRLKRNIPLFEVSPRRQYKYKGKYYSLPQLAKKLNFNYERVKHLIKKRGFNLHEAIIKSNKHIKYKKIKHTTK